MDFIGPFYDYFIAKHGVDTFNKIKDMILSKIQSFKYPVQEYMTEKEFNKVYVIFVFEIALANYWGMNDTQISKYIQLTMTNEMISELSVKKAKVVHANAIKLIQSYLQQTEREVQEEFNNER